ncbi:hypothetical protein VE02_08576 [Pseudogymnoascus sp. 03VT05]|nr:hypothetical protein VE02_08576 [Pseudogymnoascus sp. 03VT05]
MEERRRMSLGHLKTLLTRQQGSSHSPEPPPCPPKHSLDTLPTEILIQIFTNLELIDASCLSLASPRLYIINSSLNPGPIPLTTPCPTSALRHAALGSPAFEHAIIRWRASILQHKRYPGPPPLCPHSCSQDCALHFHIRDWMPAETLFCGSCEKFANWVQVDGFRCPCKGVRRPGSLFKERYGASGPGTRRDTVLLSTTWYPSCYKSGQAGIWILLLGLAEWLALNLMLV